MRIAISPDENPGDSGSVAADGTTERSVNLRVCLALQAVLARCRQDVWFDPDITFEERVLRANGDGTQLLVACAHNESTDGLSGTQFVFCPGGAVFGLQSLAAANVYTELATIPGWPRRRPDAIEDIYECCAFDRDTLYCELLFMSPQDQVLWSRPDYAQLVAEEMAQGLAITYGFEYVAPPQPKQAPAPPPPPPPPPPEEAGPMVTILYATQLHLFFVDSKGDLVHRWTGGEGIANDVETLAQGLVPWSQLTATTFGTQLQVFGQTADGKVGHAWYVPTTNSWNYESLR